MDRMLYIGMSGAKERFLAIAQNNHNLANVSTSGFREELSQFRSQPVFGPGMPTRAYAMDERPGMSIRTGPFVATGNDMDIAIKGQGWIGVQARDGSEAYTRAGDLQINVQGLLVTGTGLPVLGNGGPIAIPPGGTVRIMPDGGVEFQPAGQGANGRVVLDRIKLVNPDRSQIEKGEDGLVRALDGQNLPVDPRVTVVNGGFEGSNVNPADALVKMIQLHRDYDLQIKSMSTAQELDRASQDILKMG